MQVEIRTRSPKPEFTGREGGAEGGTNGSSGAALATREILEMLAARGADCRVLSTGVLDYEKQLVSVLKNNWCQFWFHGKTELPSREGAPGGLD